MYRFALLLLLLVPQAKSVRWFEVSSEHFLLFTDTSEVKGRRLITDFENRVATFSQAFGKVPSRQFPIEIFLFDQDADVAEVLPRVQGPEAEDQLRKNAFLFRGPDRVFIVAKDKSPEDIADHVGHALGHVLFERYAMWRPFWLAEAAGEYVRKAGRSADTKPIKAEEAFSVADMFTIVPSATYKDEDPPTVFRTEAYRLLRFIVEQKPDALRQYQQELRKEAEKTPTIAVDGDSIETQFRASVETPLKMALVTPAIKAVEVDAARVALHRGDLLLASDRASEAGRYYNADSRDARAARAIITRFTRPPAEGIRILERTAREIPDNGLVQYHFGSMSIEDKKDVQLQVAALERATKLLPLMGRAFAELARVFALNGEGEKSLPLISKALELEPEYADHIYAIRADVHVALGQFSEAVRIINISADLPHVDRAVL